jgi:hypothetical protein
VEGLLRPYVVSALEVGSGVDCLLLVDLSIRWSRLQYEQRIHSVSIPIRISIKGLEP